MSLPLSTSQNVTAPSFDPAASVDPSGERATDAGTSPSSKTLRLLWPVVRSQTKIVPSFAPVARDLLSAAKRGR